MKSFLPMIMVMIEESLKINISDCYKKVIEKRLEELKLVFDNVEHYKEFETLAEESLNNGLLNDYFIFNCLYNHFKKEEALYEF
jgi:hypothetical protein